MIHRSLGVSQRIIPHGLRVSANGGKMHAHQATAEGCFQRGNLPQPYAYTVHQETHSMSNVDLSPVRSQFPALALQDAGRPAVYFDGPGGTQVPQTRGGRDGPLSDPRQRQPRRRLSHQPGKRRHPRRGARGDGRPAQRALGPGDRLRRQHDHADLCVQPGHRPRAGAGRRDHHHPAGSRRRPGALAGAGRAWRDRPRDRL